MKVCLIYFGMIFISQNIFARPTDLDPSEDNLNVYTDLKYIDKVGVIQYKKEAYNSEIEDVEEATEDNKREQRSVGDSKAIGNAKLNQFSVVDELEYKKGAYSSEIDVLDVEEVFEHNKREPRSVGTSKNIVNVKPNQFNVVNNDLSIHNVRKNSKNTGVNQFLQQEKQSNTIQNNPVNVTTANHKYYSCKIKRNTTRTNAVEKPGTYDILFYDFVKNVNTNKFNIANSTVIHGYYGDIQVKNVGSHVQANKPNAGNNKHVNTNTVSTVHDNIHKNKVQVIHATNQAHGKRTTGSNNDITSQVEEVITKKKVTNSECFIAASNCPSDMMKDPSGQYCIPIYDNMDDVPDMVDYDYGN